MRYIDTSQQVIPKHCIYGPRPAEGIVLNNVEWWSINDHLIKEQREKELFAVLREKEDAKKQFSYNMTKTWKNTLASIKTLGNQRRMEKMEKEKQDKIDQYNEIMKTRKEEKRKLLERVKSVLYEENDYIKTINSAVMLSTVLDERKKQIEFKKNADEMEIIKDKELAAKFKKDAEDFDRLKLEEKIKEKAKKEIQKSYLDKQMEEIKKKKQMELDELEAEKQDLKNMRIEAEKIHNCNMVEQKYKKQFAAKYTQKTQGQLDFERLLVLEEEEEDAINQLYLQYNRRFKKERKEREQKMKDEVIEQRNRIAEQLAKNLRKAETNEQEVLDIEEKKKEEEFRREEERKENLRKQTWADLSEGLKKAREDRARRDYESNERKKWEMIQQYRWAELNEEWREGHRKRKKEIQKEMKAYYDKQCEQMREAKERNEEEWSAPVVNESTEREDVRQYCQSTLEFVKKHNLPEYPVKAAVERVKKQLRIKDEKDEQEKNDESNQKKSKTKPVTGFCYCFKD